MALRSETLEYVPDDRDFRDVWKTIKIFKILNLSRFLKLPIKSTIFKTLNSQILPRLSKCPRRSRFLSRKSISRFSKFSTVKTCQDDRDSRSLKLVDLKTIKSTISKTLGSQNLPKLSGYLRRSKTLKIFETCKTLKNQDSQNSQQPRDLPRLSGLKVHQSVKRRTTPSVKIEFQSDTEYPRHWQPALGDSRLVGGSQVPLVPFTSDPRPRNNCLRPSSPVVQPLHLREPAG